MKKINLNKLKIEVIRSNFYKIITSKGIYLQSYNTIVAFIATEESDLYNVTYISKYWDKHSNTTTRHIAKYLGYNTNELRKAIKNDKFKLVEFIY